MIIATFITVLFIYLFWLYPFVISKRIGKTTKTWEHSHDGKFYLEKALFTLTNYLLVVALWLAFVYPNFFDEYSIDSATIDQLGVAIVIIGAFVAIKSQLDMRNSWRTGIEVDNKTNLVSGGLYKYSRNPFYSGLILIFFGAGFATNNLIIIVIAVIEYYLIHEQVKKEEKSMYRTHGKHYTKYRKSVRRYLGEFRSIYLVPFLLIALSTSPAYSQKASITVNVENVNSQKGDLVVSLYNRPNRFPKPGFEFKKIVHKLVSSITSVTFKNIPEGEYGVALFHDENSDGKCNKSLLGIPTESYGFSNNAKPILSAPSFNNVKFKALGDTTISIKLIGD